MVGQADSNTTVSVNLTGTLFNPSSSEWNIRITGELPSNATRDIRIFGHQLTTNAVDVRTSGRATSVATNDVRLTSRQDNEFTFDIRLVGEAPSSKAVDARMVGTADTTYTQDLRLQAENTSSTETAVRIAGVIQTEREVRIVGGNLVASSFENDVWIIGKPVAQKARPDGVVSNDG